MRTHTSVFGSLKGLLVYLVLGIGCLIILFPTFLTVITAFKTPSESAQSFFSLPGELRFDNFQEVIRRNNFFVYITNSLVITGISLLGILIISPMTSYAIARNFQKRYYRFIFYYITLGLFIPFQVIMLPISKQMSSMHLLNQSGLIILYLTYSLLQSVFLTVGYIRTLPMDMEEAAYIDGCNRYSAYIRIVFPMLKPICATVVIMNGVWIWNDFLLPLIILNRSDRFWTIQLFQFNFQSQYFSNFNLAFASFLLSSLPIIFIYIFMQKYIISGLTQGAVKG
jgi:raffinose/stachyose/melibiose transport system permease protein